MENRVNFQQQAEKYITDIASDVRPATLRTYRSILNARLLPIIGGEELEGIGNKTAKMLVQRLQTEGQSPASIRLAVKVMKTVLASAVNEEGDCLYPRQWNSKFIKAPKVVDQKAPVMGLGAASKAVGASSGQVAGLIALLGGTGLRVGEALAVTVQSGPGNVWEPATATITVGATETPSGLQNAPKTDAGKRIVDIPKALNDFLTGLNRPVGARLFPMSRSTARREFMKLGIPGFHSMRRMRITYLDNQNVPRSLVKFWAGHAAGDVTERYLKGGTEIDQRKDWSEKAGLGFTINAAKAARKVDDEQINGY